MEKSAVTLDFSRNNGDDLQSKSRPCSGTGLVTLERTKPVSDIYTRPQTHANVWGSGDGAMTLPAPQDPNWDQTVIESVGPWLKSNMCAGVGSTTRYKTTGDQPDAAAQQRRPSVFRYVRFGRRLINLELR